MKALVLKGPKEFSYEEMAIPKVGAEEVRVRVRACGICGSDVHGMDGSTGRRRPPIVMGHEAAGIIDKVGAAVVDWQPGDRVTMDSTIYCGSCFFCRQGRNNLCDHRLISGVSCEEFHRHGAFAEYVVLPQRILYRIPEGITFEQAAMVEPVSVAMHAVRRTPLAMNDSAVVIGTGMIGLLVVQALRAAGCGTIIGVDIDQDKLDLAKKLGADVGLKSDACDVREEIAKLTEGRGVNAAFEVVGISETVQLGIAALRKGGALTLVGNLSPMVEIPLQAIISHEITLYGSVASCGEYPACLEMMARGHINVDAFISATAPLCEGENWFGRLYKNEAGLMKVILVP